MKTLRTAVGLPFALGVTAPRVSAQQEAAAPEREPRQIGVTILGMSCPFCVYGVQQKFQLLGGVEDLNVELSIGLVTLTLEDGVDISNELLQETGVMVVRTSFHRASIAFSSHALTVGGV